VLNELERLKGEIVEAMAAGAVLFKDAGDAKAKLGWLSRGHMKLFMGHDWELGCPPLLPPQVGGPNPPVQVGSHFKEDKDRDRGQHRGGKRTVRELQIVALFLPIIRCGQMKQLIANYWVAGDPTQLKLLGCELELALKPS
jgi:hypothetical protein